MSNTDKQAPQHQAREFHLPALEGQTAIDLMAEASGLSRSRCKQAMQRGAVWLSDKGSTRRLRRASKHLPTGSELHFYYNPDVLDALPPEPRLIADEGAYSVWFKPYGMLSQGSKWADHCAIDRWVAQHHQPQQPCFLVHRLDRAATGLILLAHGKGTAAKLAALFEQRRVDKTYRVIVHGKPEPFAATVNADIDERSAVSHYQQLDYHPDQDRALLAVSIETGRKHQIRRHLAGLGHPVVGDRLYGNGGDKEDLQLSACQLAFTCPITDQRRAYGLPQNLMPLW